MENHKEMPLNIIDALYFKESWATCLTNDLPDLFSAYNEVKGTAQRVFVYAIQADAIIKTLPRKIYEASYPKFKIHMACNPKLPKDRINNVPRFFPILNVVLPDANDTSYYFAMHWDKDYVMEEKTPNHQGLQARIDRQTLHEFLLGWCICKHNELAKPFEGLSNYVQQRVNHYHFKDDAKEIYDDLIALPSPDFIRVFLGVGHPHRGNDHPFQFRPILQIGKEEASTSNNGGSSQYEFSTPCPPCQ